MARVLVVDDEPEILELCQVNLELAGHEVVGVTNGSDALTKVRTWRPDIVFLDLMMPEVDGWQVLREIRADPDTHDLPVVLLTARAGLDDQIRGWREGIFDYIVKPFNPLKLSEWVERAAEPDPEFLDRRRQRHLEQLHFLRELQGGG